VTPDYYLVLAAILFTIGATGVLVRRNAIVLFMCIELMLNAANLALVTFSRINGSLDGQIMYAVGPSPAKPGQIIGSAGPTTTERMGRYLPALFSAGVRAVIGKGELHGRDMAAFTEHGAIYFAAIGGLGALLAKQIAAAHVIAYGDLGPEALYGLDVMAFPVVVIIDRAGRNFHETARAAWRLP